MTPPSDFLNVAAIQMVSTSIPDDNLVRAEKLIARAAKGGAELVVLPESFALMCGEDTRAIAEKEEQSSVIQHFLAEQALRHKLWLVGGTVARINPIMHGLKLFNETSEPACSPKAYAAVHTFNPNGVLAGRYDKVHLFDAGVDDGVGQYCESNTIAAGKHLGVVDTPWGRLGVGVCYDLRFPEYFRLLQQAGVDFIAVPSAFTYQTGLAHWSVLLRARAIENQCAVIAANQGGQHSANRKTFGHSCVIDAWGAVQTMQQDLGEGVVHARIDLQAQKALRLKMPVLEHRRLKEN